MKILITGGAGYLGTQLVKDILAKEEVQEVIVYDNFFRNNFNLFLGAPLPNGEKVRFVQGDILDRRKLAKALKGVDVVYHLAAQVSTPYSYEDPHGFEQVNHWGTADLVEAVEGSDVKQFVYVSSVSVYGRTSEPVNEHSATNPRSPYGISKLRGEEHVARLGKKMKTYILRSGNIYGYNKSMRFDAVINRFMFEAQFNGRISIDGSGKQMRAFVSLQHISSVLRDIVFADVPSGTYNVVGRNLSILDVVDTMKEVYPELEFIFVNQHLNLEGAQVESETELSDYLDMPETQSLYDELMHFKSGFAFQHGVSQSEHWIFNI
ncbi:MAG: SDR family oxidoreductase [Cytophagales bacterium]|nr:SDR family oxidoreductase [Cytophagales bacterium]